MSRLCEMIWVAADDVDKDVVEPLTHLLATAVALDTGRPVSIYTIGGNPAFLFWDAPHRQFGTANVGGFSLTTLAFNSAKAANVGADVHRYVFIVNPAQPRTLSTIAPGETLDRVVFLTDALQAVLPADFKTMLPAIRRSGNTVPFSSYVPSIVIRSPSSFSPIVAALTAPLTGGEPDLEVRAIADDVPDDPTLPNFAEDEIISRDACTVAFDLARVRNDWQPWGLAAKDQLPPFFDAVSGAHQKAASAWGRAVTNRRVGVAVSGGGACGFRAGPLLDEIESQDVPIDVFAGLSGGALVAAYYCCRGKAGFNLAADLGVFFQLSMPLVLLTSWPLAFVTDVMLGGRRIEELETRFVPVTTALPQAGPPFAAIVVGGTVGNGVRASGTLPPGFAPTRVDGTGYTDGASTAILPLRILRDYGGADAVLACDINPGPERSNPLGFSPIGRFLHDYTPIGRLFDLWSTLAFFSQRAARSFGMTADAYVEFPPEMIPLLESVMFWNSWGIIENAKTAQQLLQKKVDKLKQAWLNL